MRKKYYIAVQSSRCSSTFRRNVLYPSSGSRSQERNQQEANGKQSHTWRLVVTGFLLDILFDPEDGNNTFLTLVNFYRTTRHYIPEDRILHNYRCENIRANIVIFLSLIISEVSFWNLMSDEKYLNLGKVTFCFTSFFSSTYLPSGRPCLTDSHLDLYLLAIRHRNSEN
jgi:hypothetical protein